MSNIKAYLVVKRLIKMAKFIQQKCVLYIVGKDYGCLLYLAELMAMSQGLALRFYACASFFKKTN